MTKAEEFLWVWDQRASELRMEPQAQKRPRVIESEWMKGLGR
jgi:hypothetical protein